MFVKKEKPDYLSIDFTNMEKDDYYFSQEKFSSDVRDYIISSARKHGVAIMVTNEKDGTGIYCTGKREIVDYHMKLIKIIRCNFDGLAIGDIKSKVGIPYRDLKNYLQDLEEEGFIYTEKEAPSGRGRPTTKYKPVS